jgi:integrase
VSPYELVDSEKTAFPVGALCEAVGVSRSLLYGFLHREGMRRSEATGLNWQDVDLEHVVVRLDENKTDHARWWKMAPGVPEALKAWWKLQGEPQPDTPVFMEFDSEAIDVTTSPCASASTFERPRSRGTSSMRRVRTVAVSPPTASGTRL